MADAKDAAEAAHHQRAMAADQDGRSGACQPARTFSKIRRVQEYLRH